MLHKPGAGIGRGQGIAGGAMGKHGQPFPQPPKHGLSAPASAPRPLESKGQAAGPGSAGTSYPRPPEGSGERPRSGAATSAAARADALSRPGLHSRSSSRGGCFPESSRGQVPGSAPPPARGPALFAPSTWFLRCASWKCEGCCHRGRLPPAAHGAGTPPPTEPRVRPRRAAACPGVPGSAADTSLAGGSAGAAGLELLPKL